MDLLIPPLPLLYSSKKNCLSYLGCVYPFSIWVTFASPFATCQPLENSLWGFLSAKISRKWTSLGHQVGLTRRGRKQRLLSYCHNFPEMCCLLINIYSNFLPLRIRPTSSGSNKKVLHYPKGKIP